MAEDRDAKKRAKRSLEDIATLRKTPAFGEYFVRRVEEELAKRREKALHDTTLTRDQLWEERLSYLAERKIAQLMDEDEAAFRSIVGDDGDGD